MFFFKKKQSIADLAWLQTDMHSHMIPGVDDGAPDVDASMQMLRGFAALGYKKVITTPHILWEMYPNTAETISPGLHQLKQEIAKEGLGIELEAAAEYFLDEHFVEDLKANKPLLPISGNQVLVEISTINAPFDFQEVIFEIQLRNYVPVIAHPERYIYLKSSKPVFDDLKNAGCLFQLNLLSLGGHYGNGVQELAEYLVKKEYYDYIGTDMHHVQHLRMLQHLHAHSLLTRLKDSGKIRNATL